MSQNFKTLLVANPASGGGTLGRQWGAVADRIRRSFGPFEHRFTEYPGHATVITREALRAGYEQVVALGGDGTINQVAAGFMDGEDPVSPEAVLGVVPQGTGGDFRRTARISKRLERSAAALRGRNCCPLDIGRLRYTNDDGALAEGWFINIASFGMGGLVSALVNKTTKAFGGTASFFAATARAALRYRNPRVELTVDDAPPFQESIVNVAVANGQYFGGGMRVAPYARLDDGYLDVITIGDFAPTEMLTTAYRLYLGTHLGHPKVRPERGRTVHARAMDPGIEVRLDVDGETPGRLPASFEIRPGALNLKLPG